MKIMHSRMVQEEFTLSKIEVRDIVDRYLRDLIYPGEYLRLEDGAQVVKQDDPHWHHGSVREYYVRDATDLDLAIFKILETL